jgi:hypothetical protein
MQNQMMQSCFMQLKLVQPLKLTGQVSIRRDNFPYANAKGGLEAVGQRYQKNLREKVQDTICDPNC